MKAIYRAWSLKISKHKTLEVGVDVHKNWNTYFAFHTTWVRRCDHAGFSLGVDLLIFSFNFNILDTRHWDYDNNMWYKYNEKHRLSKYECVDYTCMRDNVKAYGKFIVE